MATNNGDRGSDESIVSLAALAVCYARYSAVARQIDCRSFGANLSSHFFGNQVVYEKAFKQDWDKLKDELEEYGVKKPAVIKKFGPFERRVASGIGAAMKVLDKVDPGVVKGVTDKIAKDYAKAVEELEIAVSKELSAINDELETLKKEDKDYKTNRYFRGLKVFQSKLSEYVSQAQARLVEFQTELKKELTDGDKQIKAFKSKCTAAVARAVSAIKKVKLTPTADAYHAEINVSAAELVLVCSTGTTMERWQHHDDLGDRWDYLRGQVSNFKNEIRPHGTEDEKAEQVLGQLAEFSKQLKKIGDLLAAIQN